MTNQDNEPYWVNEREIAYERCGNDCDCRKEDSPETWCARHAEAWKDEAESEQGSEEDETYQLTPAGVIVADLLKQNQDLLAIVNKLFIERDDARRLLCAEWAKQDGLPVDWQGRRGAEGMAEFVGWDCFKENTDV